MRLISTTEAATHKNTTRQTIAAAIKRGELEAEKIGERVLAVKANQKFEAWNPNPKSQQAGRLTWSPSKAAPKAKKARRSA